MATLHMQARMPALTICSLFSVQDPRPWNSVTHISRSSVCQGRQLGLEKKSRLQVRLLTSIQPRNSFTHPNIGYRVDSKSHQVGNHHPSQHPEASEKWGLSTSKKTMKLVQDTSGSNIIHRHKEKCQEFLQHESPFICVLLLL